MPTRLSPQYRESFIEELGNSLRELPHAIEGSVGLHFDPHQEKINQEILREIEQQRQSTCCAVACCGSGKTTVEVNLVAASQRAKKKLGINGEKKDVIIAPERFIVGGIRDEFARFGYETGVLMGGEKKLDPSIIVSTVQYLQNALTRKKLYDLLPPGSIDLAIFDEVDLFLTENRNELLIPALDPRMRIGFTATPKWPDGRHITQVFGRQVSELKLREGILTGINAEPDFYLFEARLDESKLKLRADDYDPSILASGLKQAEIHLAFPEIYERVVPENRRKDWPTLGYVPGMKLASAVAESMNARFGDIKTLAITTETMRGKNVEDIRKQFVSGEVQVLIFCEMGARGMNLENAAVLIDAYPTLSLNKLEQRHGRVLRKIRKGSALWESGWRKEQAVIAQVIPKSNRFRRPAMFTDIIRQEDLQTFRTRKKGGEAGGAPLVDMIDEVRQLIESKNPAHYVDLVEHLNVIEEIRRIEELPRFDQSGYFQVPRRYRHE